VAFIDISATYPQVEEFLKLSDLTVKHLLITHAHPSHLIALEKIKTQFEGAFYLHPNDSDLLKDANVQIEPDLLLKDGMVLKLGNGQIKVLHTPGHTDGSVCFYVKDMDGLFSGRTLEKGGYGTIWGPTSMNHMLSSLRRLNNAFYSTTVYPGRGEQTTIAKEAWLNCLRSH
jgi:glyoxylase-like metal-dependent hydrolase (beta-lactamase superfamily II)